MSQTFRVATLLAAACLPSTLEAVGFKGWLMRSGPDGRIGLLSRQPLATLLLPGETRSIHVAAQRDRDILSKAVQKDFGLVAMQLVTPGGNTASVVPLLEVDSISSGGTSGGTFASVRCVGRARLCAVRADGTATVNPFGDAGVEMPDIPAAALLVRELHGRCHALGAQLLEPPQPPPSEQQQAPRSLAQRILTKRQLEDSRPTELAESQPTSAWSSDEAVGPSSAPAAVRLARPPARFAKSLDEQMEHSRSTLLAQAGAQHLWPMPSLKRLPLWSSHDRSANADEDSELVLLSFAACAPLSPFERLHALEATLTVERLQHAAKALQRQRARLSAKLALGRL